MEQRVRDIMQQHVLQVSPDDPITSVCRMFIDEQISGAPVVSDAGKVVGVVSLTDIVRGAGEELPYPVGETAYYRQIRATQPAWMEDPGELATRLEVLRVADVMTEKVVKIQSGSSLSAFAKLVLQIMYS